MSSGTRSARNRRKQWGCHRRACTGGRLSAGEVAVVKARGVGRVPKKKKKVTAVILQVTTKGKGEAGRFAAYAVGGVDRGTTSALIPAEGRHTSLLVADIGDKGLIALAASRKEQSHRQDRRIYPALVTWPSSRVEGRLDDRLDDRAVA